MNYQCKLLSFLISLTLSNSLYAKHLNELVNSLLTVNKPLIISCEEMNVDKITDDEVVKLCVEQVCGPAQNYPVTVDQESIKNYLHPGTQKQIADLEQEFKLKQETLERYIIFVTQKQKEMQNISDITKISDDDAEKILSQIINKIKVKNRLRDLETPINSNNIKLSVLINSNYSEIYNKVISKIDISEHIYFATNSGVLIDEQKQFDNFIKNVNFFKDEIKRKKVKSNYNFKEKINFIKKNGYSSAAHFNKELHREANFLGIQLEKPVCSADCKRNLITHIKNDFFFNAEYVKKQAQQNFTGEDSFAVCKSSIMNHNINVRNSEEIEKEWPKLIARLQSNSSLHLSDHSKKLLIDRINDQLKLSFKKDPFVYQLTTPKASVMENIMKDSSLASSYEVATNRQSFEENAQEPRCDNNYNDRILYDNFDHEEMKIIVSPYSCEHHHSGKEILGHEFGHAVAYLIGNTEGMSDETKKNHIKLRACSGSEIASIKTEVEREDEFIPSFPGDYLTTEEDTADLLGFSLSNDKDSFTGCVLTTDGTNYSSISMITDEESPHTPPVIRLMIELQYKNPSKINEACVEVIRRSKSKINNKCF